MKITSTTTTRNVHRPRWRCRRACLTSLTRNRHVRHSRRCLSSSSVTSSSDGPLNVTFARLFGCVHPHLECLIEFISPLPYGGRKLNASWLVSSTYGQPIDTLAIVAANGMQASNLQMLPVLEMAPPYCACFSSNNRGLITGNASVQFVERAGTRVDVGLRDASWQKLAMIKIDTL